MRTITIALAILLLIVPPARAVEQSIVLGRYEARAIVTGTDLRDRPKGLAACLRDVLIKVSGDPTIADDPRLAALQARAADFVVDFDYWDRMSGIAHHDEQGSSDRPYNLTARFDPTRIDAALHDLGRAPWPDPRPALLLIIDVHGGHGNFFITRHEPEAEGMRAAIAAAAQKYGMTIALPESETEAENYQSTPTLVAVAGGLVLSQAALGWVADWHLTWQGRDYTWQIGGVNFDEAFRNGVRGAMQVLSGHGAPN